MRHIPFFIKNAALNERVRLVVVEDIPMPVGANPFHYDAFSMGTEVDKGITAMTSAAQDGDWKYLRLDVSHTGQRFEVVAVPETPTPREYIEVFLGNKYSGVGRPFGVEANKVDVKDCIPSGDKDIVTMPTVVGAFTVPVYVFHENKGILLKSLVTKTKEEVIEIIRANAFIEDDEIEYLFNKLWDVLNSATHFEQYLERDRVMHLR